MTTQKEKIDQMQVVLQEFETTALEMAHKYDEEKNNLEMEKAEVRVTKILLHPLTTK